MKYFLLFFIFSLFYSCSSQDQKTLKTKDLNNLTVPPTFNFDRKPIGSPLSDFYVPATPEQFVKVEESNDVHKINYGYSFGQCVGFCQSEVKFSSNGIIISSYNWKTEQNKIEYKNLDENVYDSLVSSIDFKELLIFNDNLGCGDCADGGSEWITISKGEQSKKLFGTYGFNSPVCLGGLLDYIRKVKL